MCSRPCPSLALCTSLDGGAPSHELRAIFRVGTGHPTPGLDLMLGFGCVVFCMHQFSPTPREKRSNFFSLDFSHLQPLPFTNNSSTANPLLPRYVTIKRSNAGDSIATGLMPFAMAEESNQQYIACPQALGIQSLGVWILIS